MSCTQWNECLIGRLYGEIEADDDAALTVHLASCESCRETLDELRRVQTLMRENEPVTPRVPRVVVLRDRARFRPALLAASLLGAAVLAGAGAGMGYAMGTGRGVVPPPTATDGAATIPTEELVRREVDRRLAAMKDAQMVANGSSSGLPPTDPAVDRPVTSKALGAELAKFERRLNSTRAAELEYVLDQIAASEFRVGTRLGKTNEALRSVALASNPYVNEQ